MAKNVNMYVLITEIFLKVDPFYKMMILLFC